MRCVSFFDILGVDVFSAAKDDHLFRSSGDVEESVFIQIAEITGSEPSLVGERCRVGIGIVVVARKNTRPLDLDFSDARIVRGVNADHSPRYRLALTSDFLLQR